MLPSHERVGLEATGLRARLKRAVKTPVALATAGADLRSVARLARLRYLPSGGGRPVAVRVRKLAGRQFHLRPGTTDVLAFCDSFIAESFSPPREIAGHDLRVIVELGANIGGGLAALATRYPDARLLGVEADPGNAEMARRNLAAWSDRCEVVQAAVWDDDCELTVEGDDEYGYMVRPRQAGDAPGVHACTVSTLLERYLPDEPIDYMTLSVERSEQRILTSNTLWLERVAAIRVETYQDAPYTPSDTVRDLERAGFAARCESDLFGSWAQGVRTVSA